MRPAEIIAIDARARARFVYVEDVMDMWRSHADAVERGEEWRGDCDDLTSTTLDLLTRAGLPITQAYRLHVNAGNGPHAGNSATDVNHQIAVVLDDRGDAWVVGDTFGPAYPYTRMEHVVCYHHRLDRRSSKGAPFVPGAPPL